MIERACGFCFYAEPEGDKGRRIRCHKVPMTGNEITGYHFPLAPIQEFCYEFKEDKDKKKVKEELQAAQDRVAKRKKDREEGERIQAEDAAKRAAVEAGVAQKRVDMGVPVRPQSKARGSVTSGSGEVPKKPWQKAK